MRLANRVLVPTVAVVLVGGAIVGNQVAGADAPDGPQFRPVPARALANQKSTKRVLRLPDAPPRVPVTTMTSDAVARRAVQGARQDQVLQRVPGLSGTARARTPQTSLAVGSKQILQVGAAGVGMWRKADGALLGKSTNLKKFFGIKTAGTTITQPTVVYDALDKRFVVAAVSTNAGSTGFVVRVSKGSTLTTRQSSWRRPYGYDDADSVTESQPALGVSGDKIVVTAQASDTGDPSVANSILVISKPRLYAAGATGPSAWTSTVDNTYDGQAPAVNLSRGNAAFVAVPDTTDFTVYTLTGAATTKRPRFSKSVMYPSAPLVDAPNVSQGSEDPISLPSAIQSASVAWRNNRFWAALTVGCTPTGDVQQRACLRILEITTGNGVSLAADRQRGRSGENWFAPGVSIDRGNRPHLAFSTSDPTPTAGPVTVSTSVMGLRKGRWTSPTRVARGSAQFSDGTGAPPARWADAGTAAADPTSGWDVWVAGVSARSGAAPNWGTTLARASLARNVVRVGASSTRVTRGTRITVRVRLTRPQSKDAVAGLPVALQSRSGNGRWRTVGSARTKANGMRSWTVRVRGTTQFRGVGKAARTRGLWVEQVVSRPLRVTVR